ncbi:MAG: hypothetical protein AAFW88_05250, partial [Pseudomonadota bacterium]
MIKQAALAPPSCDVSFPYSVDRPRPLVYATGCFRYVYLQPVRQFCVAEAGQQGACPMLKKTLTRSIAVLLLALNAGAVAQDSIKETLFENARETLGRANAARASYLAPESYADGATHFKRAEDMLTRGGNLDRIRKELADADEDWAKAIAAAAKARSLLENTIQAREDAISADAENYATEQWEQAEKIFVDATSRLENGSEKAAARMGSRAETEYRAAELAAIKANFLNETEALLERADDLKAD